MLYPGSELQIQNRKPSINFNLIHSSSQWFAKASSVMLTRLTYMSRQLHSHVKFALIVNQPVGEVYINFSEAKKMMWRFSIASRHSWINLSRVIKKRRLLWWNTHHHQQCGIALLAQRLWLLLLAQIKYTQWASSALSTREPIT